MQNRSIFRFSETMETCISGGFFFVHSPIFQADFFFIDCSPILYEMHFNLFRTNLEMISIFWRKMEKFRKYFWYVALFVQPAKETKLFCNCSTVAGERITYVGVHDVRRVKI